MNGHYIARGTFVWTGLGDGPGYAPGDHPFAPRDFVVHLTHGREHGHDDLETVRRVLVVGHYGSTQHASQVRVDTLTVTQEGDVQ